MLPTAHINVPFPNEDSFIRWKFEIENTGNFKFKIHRGRYTNSSGNTTRYFVCINGSTFYQSKQLNKGNLRCTHKKQYYCPSRITATNQADGSIMVSYVSTHIPHGNEHSVNDSLTFLKSSICANLEKISTEVRKSNEEPFVLALDEQLKKLIKEMEIGSIPSIIPINVTNHKANNRASSHTNKTPNSQPPPQQPLFPLLRSPSTSMMEGMSWMKYVARQQLQ